jgi:hypothetical protein
VLVGIVVNVVFVVPICCPNMISINFTKKHTRKCIINNKNIVDDIIELLLKYGSDENIFFYCIDYQHHHNAFFTLTIIVWTK